MPRFLIHHPNEGSRVFELLGDRPISVGRAKSSNLVLDNASVSRQHAVVRSTPDGKWQIIDRAATNGVKVNGVAVKEVELRANDEIVLGEYRLRFFDDSASKDMVTYGTPELPPESARCFPSRPTPAPSCPCSPWETWPPPRWNEAPGRARTIACTRSNAKTAC